MIKANLALLTYLTSIFHVAVRLFSNRSQMTSKCVKSKKVAHEDVAECVTDVLTTFWCLHQWHTRLRLRVPLFISIRFIQAWHLFAVCHSFVLERFSFDCRKVIGFALSTLRDWLKRFAPLFHPIRSTTKTNCDARSHAFSRALHQLPVITPSFDWFTVLSVSFVIG